MSIPANKSLAMVLYYASRYDAAIKQCHKTIEMAPDFAPIYNWLGLVHTAKGNYDDALEALERGLSLAEDHPSLQTHLMTLHVFPCSFRSRWKPMKVSFAPRFLRLPEPPRAGSHARTTIMISLSEAMIVNLN